MSRFQHEVTQMDRRHGLVMRLMSLGFAATVIVVALWAAGMPPTQWVARLARLVEGSQSTGTEKASDEKQAAITPAPHAQAPVVAPADPYALAGTDSSVSKTPLPLYLLGVAPGRRANEGTANIGTSIDNPQTYVAGAMLANGSTLAEIHSDYVLLKNGAQSARLKLHRRNDPATAAISKDGLLFVSGSVAAPTVPASSREVLTDYLRPSPVYDGERLLGYQVYPGARSAQFARLGLRAGDVIVAIDDMPLSDPEQTIQMLRLLTEGAVLTATIERKSRRERVTLDGAAITADLEQAQRANQSSAVSQPAIY